MPTYSVHRPTIYVGDESEDMARYIWLWRLTVRLARYEILKLREEVKHA